MLRMLVVRELWSLWLSRKMDINFDRKIISNTNRQYLVQDFLETRVSFQTNQIQNLPLKQNGKHHKCVYEQKLKRVPTYFISINHFNGTELTVIYFVNLPFSMQKGRFLSLNPLLNAGGVISV